MDPIIRAAIIEEFNTLTTIPASDISDTLQYHKDIPRDDTLKNIHWMLDSGELKREISGLRLTLQVKEATAPWTSRIKKYMEDNLLIVISLALSAIGTISGIAGTIIALIALHKH